MCPYLLLNDFGLIKLIRLKNKHAELQNTLNALLVNHSTLRNEIFSSRIINYYEDNLLLRSSRNFKFCLNNLKKVQFIKKNVV